MAPFNPEIKDISPVNPIGYSKSAEVPNQFASVFGKAVEGVGNIIGLGAKAADEIVKDRGRNQAETIFRPEVDNELSRLAGLDFQMKLNQAVTATTDATNTKGIAPISSALGDNFVTSDGEPPSQLKDLPKDLSIMDDARKNGKLSESGFLGRVAALAKDLRSQYPIGYRSYIDAEISKVVGFDPANEWRRSMIGDINANLTSAQAEHNKILGKLMDVIALDEHNGPKMYAGFADGKISRDAALEFIARNEAIDVKFKRDTQRFQLGEMNDKLLKADAKESFTTYANNTVNSLIKGDLETKGLTGQAIQKLTEDALAGNKVLPAEEYVKLAGQIQGQMLAAATKLRTELTRTGPGREKPWGSILDKEGSQIIEDALQPYQRIIDALNKQDVGLAFMNQRLVEAANSEMAAKLYKDPSMKFFFGTMDAIKKHGGGDAAVTQFFAAGLEKKFGVDWGNYITMSKAQLATPPAAPGEPTKDIQTIPQFIKNTQTLENKLGIHTPETYAEAFSLVTAKDDRPSLLNPSTSPAIKQAIAQNFFSNDTRNWLRLIKSDTIDEHGRKIDGRETWFKNFTRPDVVEAISQLGEDTRKQYYDWVQTSYEDVFGQGIRDLANQKVTGGFTIGWDDKANKLVFEDHGYKNTLNRVSMAQYKPGTTPMELNTDRINSAISGLANVYTKQGKTPEEVQEKVLESLNLTIDQYRMVKNLPTAFKASLEEKYRIRQEEIAAEEQKKAKAKMNELATKYKRLVPAFEN